MSTFNLENYSGESITVKVYKNGTFKTSGWMKGSYKEICEGVVEVKVEGYENSPIKAYGLSGGFWVAEDYDISRDGSSAIEAALKLAANIF